MLWWIHHNSEWWISKKEAWVWSTANTTCTTKGPVYETDALNEETTYQLCPRGNFTGDILINFREKDTLYTKAKPAKLGLSGLWWWLGRRGNASTVSSTGTKSGKNGTCGLFLAWIRWKTSSPTCSFFPFVCICWSWWARKTNNWKTWMAVLWECFTPQLWLEIYNESWQTFPTSMWLYISRALLVCLSVMHSATLTEKNTCFTPINQTKWLWAPARDIELKLTELKWSPPDLQTQVSPRSNAGKNNMDLTRSMKNTAAGGVLWQGCAWGEGLLGILKTTAVEMLKNHILLWTSGCNYWNVFFMKYMYFLFFSLHHQLKFYILISAQVLYNREWSVICSFGPYTRLYAL